MTDTEYLIDSKNLIFFAITVSIWYENFWKYLQTLVTAFQKRFLENKFIKKNIYLVVTIKRVTFEKMVLFKNFCVEKPLDKLTVKRGNK